MGTPENHVVAALQRGYPISGNAISSHRVRTKPTAIAVMIRGSRGLRRANPRNASGYRAVATACPSCLKLFSF